MNKMNMPELRDASKFCRAYRIQVFLFIILLIVPISYNDRRNVDYERNVKFNIKFTSKDDNLLLTTDQTTVESIEEVDSTSGDDLEKLYSLLPDDNYIENLIAFTTNANNSFIDPDEFVVNHSESPSSKTTITIAIVTTTTTTTTTPAPACPQLPYRQDLYFCPEGLQFLEPHFCYTLLKAVDYYKKCPYNNNFAHGMPVDVNMNEELTDILRVNRIWVSATRNPSHGCFGVFQFTGQSNSFEDAANVHVDDCTADCLITQNGVLNATSCKEKNNRLCIYSYFGSNFCKTYFNNQYCFLSHFDTARSSCYCKMDFCNNSIGKLAEPREPFQTQMLLKVLGNYSQSKSFSKSKFGLERQALDRFVWKSTKDVSEYSFWLNVSNCQKGEAVLEYLPAQHTQSDADGWSLVSKNESKYLSSICEFPIKKSNVTLKLKYSMIRNGLYLVVTNPAVVASDLNGDYSLYCFSDASTLTFSEKVKLEHAGKTSVRILDVPNYPSQFWCKSFQFPENKIIESNTIVAYNKTTQYGNQYALYISIKSIDARFLQTNKHGEICNHLLKEIQGETGNLILSLRPIKIVSTSKNDLSLVFLAHLTTEKSSTTQEEEYNTLNKIFQSIGSRCNTYSYNVSKLDVLSSEFCISTNSTSSNNKVLVWPQTRIGVTVIPFNTLCLDKNENMKPVIRSCKGNFIDGARWNSPEGNCVVNDTDYSETTKVLFELTKETPSDEVLIKVINITENHSEELSADIYFISSIIKSVPEESTTINKTIAYIIISNVMNYDVHVLREAQSMLNATDDILYKLDIFLSHENQTNGILQNIIFQVANFGEIIGVSLHKINSDSDSFASYKLVTWEEEDSFKKNMTDKNLEAAVMFSEETVDEIMEIVPSGKPLKLIVMMFYTNVLFNEPKDNMTRKDLKNKIVAVSIPGFGDFLNNSINVFFKLLGNTNKDVCTFWEYGWNDMMMSVHGLWSQEGDEPHQYLKFKVCKFVHLTHFGLLLGKEYLSLQQEFYLMLITALGLTFSLIGIVPIYLTFALFKSWRARSSNIILINFCVVITLQSAILYSMDYITEDGVACKVMGALLHYLVLCEFFWMLGIAFLQYRRFVHVLKPQYENPVVKCCLLGWVFPFVIISIILCESLNNYGIVEKKFCYVTSKFGLRLGLFLPIGIILIINIFVFVRIFFGIYRNSLSTDFVQIKKYKLEMNLGFFLLFVLGLTWIFGLLGILTGQMIFTYFFCATATIRGFILFYYFILSNTECRRMWAKFLKISCAKFR